MGKEASLGREARGSLSGAGYNDSTCSGSAMERNRKQGIGTSPGCLGGAGGWHRHLQRWGRFVVKSQVLFGACCFDVLPRQVSSGTYKVEFK